MRRRCGLLLPLLLAGVAEARADCPTSAEGMSRPTEASPLDWVHTEGGDRVLVSGAPSWVRHHALGGDDAIFLLGPPASATVAAGRGADIVTVCALREPSLLILAGEFEAMVGDGAPDLIVIEPEVFLGIPEGVTLQIAVQGFTAAEDRIRLRLPPGITTAFAPRPEITLQAGQVAIAVAPVDDPMPPGPEIFEIEAATPVYQPAWPAPAPPFAGYDPGLGCADAPAEAAGARTFAPVPAFRTPPLALLDPSDAPLRVAGDGEVWVEASDAADRLFVFGGPSFGAGAGGDQIIVCAIAGAELGIAAGPGSVPGIDLDADTVVIEAGRLQDMPRTLGIVNLNPLNDRVVLRLPPGLEPSFEQPQFGMPHVQVGQLRISTLAQVWERGMGGFVFDPSLFAIDRVAAP